MKNEKVEIILDMHSFVDLITNSSSTVYIAAGNSSIEWLKSLINSIIQKTGAVGDADDLFDFDIVTQCPYCDKVLTPGEDDERYYCDECDEELHEDTYEYGGVRHGLRMTSKDGAEVRFITNEIDRAFDLETVCN